MAKKGKHSPAEIAFKLTLQEVEKAMAERGLPPHRIYNLVEYLKQNDVEVLDRKIAELEAAARLPVIYGWSATQF